MRRIIIMPLLVFIFVLSGCTHKGEEREELNENVQEEVLEETEEELEDIDGDVGKEYYQGTWYTFSDNGHEMIIDIGYGVVGLYTKNPEDQVHPYYMFYKKIETGFYSDMFCITLIPETGAKMSIVFPDKNDKKNAVFFSYVNSEPLDGLYGYTMNKDSFPTRYFHIY